MDVIIKTKEKINQIIKKENPIYCDISYDGESEDEKGVWFYDLIIYDRAEKIDKITKELNKIVKTTIYKNMDDGDYTIECTIR